MIPKPYKRVYKFHDIDVGTSIDVTVDESVTDRNLRRAVSHYNVRSDKHFSCRRKGDIMQIVRNR